MKKYRMFPVLFGVLLFASSALYAEDMMANNVRSSVEDAGRKQELIQVGKNASIRVKVSNGKSRYYLYPGTMVGRNIVLMKANTAGQIKEHLTGESSRVTILTGDNSRISTEITHVEIPAGYADTPDGRKYGYAFVALKDNIVEEGNYMKLHIPDAEELTAKEMGVFMAPNKKNRGEVEYKGNIPFLSVITLNGKDYPQQTGNHIPYFTLPRVGQDALARVAVFEDNPTAIIGLARNTSYADRPGGTQQADQFLKVSQEMKNLCDKTARNYPAHQ